MIKTDVLNALVGYEILIVEQRNNIIKLRLSLENEAERSKLAREFARENEEIYLKLKQLAHDIAEDRPKNVAEAIGKTDSFPSRLENTNEGAWVFTLPPLYSVPSKEIVQNEGKHIYFLVTSLLNDAEDSGGKLKQLADPVIMFRHYINDGADLDFNTDAIDVRRAIDALKGRLLPDNEKTERITVIHDMIKSKDRDYCELLVTERKDGLAKRLLQ